MLSLQNKEINFKKLYYKNIEPLYKKKYGKMYEVVEEFIKKNKLIFGGSLSLNLVTNKQKRYGKNYPYHIITRNPYLHGNNLANELAKNGINVSLYTIEPQKSLEITIGVAAIVILTKQYHNNVIQQTEYLMYDDVLSLCFIYYNLFNINREGLWDEYQEYKEKFLNKASFRNKYIGNIPNKPYGEDIKKFINYLKNNEKFVVIGTLALNLKKGIENQNIPFQCLSYETFDNIKTNLRALFKSEITTKPIQIYDQDYLECLMVKHENFSIYIYDLLNYLPICTFNDPKININIANPYVLMYFLLYDIVNTKKEIHQKIINIIVEVLVFEKDFQMSTDAKDYVGWYKDIPSHKKEQNRIKNVFLSLYNPSKYFQEHQKYREIMQKY